MLMLIHRSSALCVSTDAYGTGILSDAGMLVVWGSVQGVRLVRQVSVPAPLAHHPLANRQILISVLEKTNIGISLL